MNNQYELYFHTDCVQKLTLNNISHSTCAFGGRGVHDASMLYHAFQNINDIKSVGNLRNVIKCIK